MNEGSTASVMQFARRCILNTFSSLVVTLYPGCAGSSLGMRLTLVGKKAMQDIDHRRG